jgi:hypothetical protein
MNLRHARTGEPLGPTAIASAPRETARHPLVATSAIVGVGPAGTTDALLATLSASSGCSVALLPSRCSRRTAIGDRRSQLDRPAALMHCRCFSGCNSVACWPMPGPPAHAVRSRRLPPTLPRPPAGTRGSSEQKARLWGRSRMLTAVEQPWIAVERLRVSSVSSVVLASPADPAQAGRSRARRTFSGCATLVVCN